MKTPVHVHATIAAFAGFAFIASDEPLGDAIEAAGFKAGESVVVLRSADLQALLSRSIFVCERQDFHDAEESLSEILTTRDGRKLCDSCFMGTAPIDEIEAHLTSMGIERPTPQQSREALLKVSDSLRKRAEEITEP